MAHRLNRTQALENTAFLKALRRTGNARLAAREVGVAYGTLQHRRGAHPAFAARWATAVAVAQARLSAAGCRAGRARPEAMSGLAAHRTRGGETVVVRFRDGRCQIRVAQPGKLTKACEQAFLSALSATANVRLSAAAAGASPRAFYRRRQQSPAFAREMRLALEMGYEQVELALIESFTADSGADDAWRHNEPPPIPPMTPEQALQLLYLHQKEARLQAEPAHLKRRRGESSEARSYRMGEMYRERQRRDLEAFEIAEAARAQKGARSPHEPPPPLLPALDQVTGWSKAGGRAPHHAERALFGGWRLGNLDTSKKRR
ncbi:hypothetical protein ASG11_14425 [Sphingomonas sp. Leaf357]|uniref:hypothetical protein n=1 Tax=Sphingomonas sp. Leaf357 TaxID=1736350 RepID=UPI0006F3D8F4|nr:hypothetical protein [Sphingomonas sp. Leaf357]KQS02001.1 hypothetical protein ASG11_14425 [Sphingomonas sp. Leaf357]